MDYTLRFSEIILIRLIIASAIGAPLGYFLFHWFGLINPSDKFGQLNPMFGLIYGIAGIGFFLYAVTELPFTRIEPSVYLGTSLEGQAHLANGKTVGLGQITYAEGGRINRTLAPVGKAHMVVYRSDGKAIEGKPFRSPIAMALFTATTSILIIGILFVFTKLGSGKSTFFDSSDVHRLKLGLSGLTAFYLVTTLIAVGIRYSRGGVPSSKQILNFGEFRSGQIIKGKILALRSVDVRRPKHGFSLNTSESKDWVDDGLKFQSHDDHRRYKNVTRYYFVVELSPEGAGVPVYVNPTLDTAVDADREKLQKLVDPVRERDFIVDHQLSVTLKS